MTAGFKVDGRDLSPHLRVNQGDGLDPYSTAGLEPQFSQNAAGEGEPLISLNQGNREQMFPVIVNPARDPLGTYASSKDGLHQLIRDIDRALANAQVIEWRDDSASNSTFFDVQYAKFEPAYDYRRAGQLWIPGVVHVWTKPYGHTGTTRILATAAASSMPVTVSASGLDGDVGALVDARISYLPATSGESLASDARYLTGVTTGRATLINPSGILKFAFGVGGSIVGGSGAIASMFRRFTSVGNSAGGSTDLINGLCAAATLTVENRTRVLALARSQMPAGAASGICLVAGDFNQRSPLGPTAPLGPSGYWRVLDLGTFDPDGPGATTITLVISAGLYGGSVATGILDFGGLLTLPEEQTALVVDPITDPDDIFAGLVGGGLVASYAFQGASGSVPFLRGTGTAAATGFRFADKWLRGEIPQAPAGTSGGQVTTFALVDGGPQTGMMGVDIRVRERFQFAR